MDAPGNYTYEIIGQRRVMARHTGHDKVSVCGLFAATASGKKLPAIVLIKRDPRKPFPGLVVPDNMIIDYSAKGTFQNKFSFKLIIINLRFIFSSLEESRTV